LITAGGAVAAGAAVSRYASIPPDSAGIYGPGETLTYAVQRVLVGQSLAREFTREKISAKPFAKGEPPPDELFREHRAKGFAEWKLSIDGMVARPVSLSIEELKGMTRRSQITMLVCEEGWSYIAEWVGVALADLLAVAGADLKAKYVVYSTLKVKRPRYDSIDMAEALHPQTLVAYGMNGAALPVGHGGPLRMRVPRQLGYKNLKFLAGITVTDDLTKLGKGRGSSSADGKYSWYAGI
jgi:DMSO/TMAO reductase YedYZ molybdopterin-dependent catalytic subunit